MTNEKEYQNTAYGCGITIATFISLAIWACIFFVVSILTSCSQLDNVQPDLCDSIKSDHYAPQRIHVVIDSDQPEVTITWSTGHTIIVEHPYYHELWLVLCEGQTMTVNGCEIN